VTLAAQRRAALATWWERGPWPATVLTVDPGASSGASISTATPSTGVELIESRHVDTWARGEVEAVVDLAVEVSLSTGLPLVAVLEDWGAGGPLGLAQWLGLAEARGVWRRALIIAARETEALTLGRILKVTQSRWRSRAIEETGVPDGALDQKTGLPKWRKFNPDEWKEVARRAALEYFLTADIPIQPDAAESATMLIYAARSDEVLKSLGKRHLKRWGIPDHHLVMLEPTIRGSKRARRAG
jgi:hypothetical protein